MNVSMSINQIAPIFVRVIAFCPPIVAAADDEKYMQFGTLKLI